MDEEGGVVAYFKEISRLLSRRTEEALLIACGPAEAGVGYLSNASDTIPLCQLDVFLCASFRDLVSQW
jgi:hypothetical protein